VFDGFEIRRIEVPGAVIHARTGGDGSPVLLLHGYPQTHAMWHRVAADLAADHVVIAPDLRGYGDSVALENDYSFRAMARDMVEVMAALGHTRFHVISHDRGARTAHRMLLDSPAQVASIALLDILPTLDVWRLMDQWLGMRYYHWLFLAQPGDMPRHLISQDPITFLHATLAGLAGSLDIFDSRALAEYERAARNPSVVTAWCEDYAAGATVDLEQDRQDLGRAMHLPSLLLWGERGVVGAQTDPLAAWRTWLPDITGHSVDAGHFLVEERPDAVIPALRAHLQRASSAL
jgi:haloacetate dehalogenase